MNDLAHELLSNSHAAPADVIKMAREGLSTDVARDIKNRYELSESEFLSILGMALRTFQRRDLLNAVESDRLLRFIRLMNIAEEVFDGADASRIWLHAENRALGGIVPVSLLDTDAGTRQVETVLGRLKYGVYS